MRASNRTTPSSVRAEIRPGIWIDARRALWLEKLRILAVADLHWGYATSHRRRGNLLPLWGDDVIESSLEALVTDYRPAEMIWVGDIVHTADGSDRAERFLERSAVPVTVLSGNHDRRWRGAVCSVARRDEFFFHHGDVTRARPEGTIEVVGHEHPAVAWHDGAGGRLKVPALVEYPQRLVLPAFSPWAAGTEYRQVGDDIPKFWAVSSTRIFAVPVFASAVA
ncbi:MAG TPA: metallophosphoesterase [Opitutaceae bacterium]|nr:metallophosphoesterase [Opitutaceae bacterium]